MDTTSFDRLRLELSVNAKNGVDFIVSATVVWTLLGYIWTLPYSAYDRSVLTFLAGSITIPLALALSKVFKTRWKSPGNLLTDPQFFIMTYAIITGAHFFPYAWYYKSLPFAVMAGVIAVGGLVLGLILPADQMYVLPFVMAGALAVLAILLMASWRNNVRACAQG